MAGLDLAVHLVGAHLEEPGGARSLAARRPVLLGADRLEEHVDADDAGAQERFRVEDRAVHVGLGGDVDHGVGFRHQPVDRVTVRDVAADEGIAGGLLGIGLHGREVGPVAGVGQLVEDRDPRAVAAGQDLPDKLRTDEPGTARDQETGAGGDAVRHAGSVGRGVGGASRPASWSTSAISAARSSDGTVPASVQWPSYTSVNRPPDGM